MAKYFYWFFDATDGLQHTQAAHCESDTAAIRDARDRMKITDASFEIYQSECARVVYRGQRAPVTEIDSPSTGQHP